MKSKKLLVGLLIGAIGIGAASGAYGASLSKKISAIQDPTVKIKVDGKTLVLADSTGAMDPIMYNGHTYVPAKSVAEAMGGAVTWDGSTNSVIISTGKGTQDNSIGDSDPGSTVEPSNTPQPTPSTTPSQTANTGASSKNKGTLSDPVSLGTAFTYHDYYHYKQEDSTNVDYTFTINKVETITADDIVKLGFKKPESDPEIEYRMLTVSLKVNNAKVTKGTSSSATGQGYLASFEPSYWGVRTNDSGKSIIGVRDYGFDGSLSDNISDVVYSLPSSKVLAGESKSYEASGKIIITVYKNETNYFILQKSDSDMDYYDRFIYFKLK
ncbi:copper amine oxidase N-terminal domain-containing protein [Gorillibacterium massiliense]|uniref:copper amine oxidase N-terminal domain-containing protein n=1 Tax=Gorillibacterium massiliense TaxID=1280390 RepID=UPI0006938619|nr:copper amine oxidase N-terminal domain-containing protein [Gorillibacterium massiliense]